MQDYCWEGLAVGKTGLALLGRAMLRLLLLGRKVMTNLDSILKSQDVTLLTEVLIVKSMVSKVVMYGCESWTIKKTEHWRIDGLNCGVGEDLRVPWAARKSDSPEVNCGSIPTSACRSSPRVHSLRLPWSTWVFPEMTWYRDGMMLGLKGPWQLQVHSEASSHGCRRYGSIMILF